MKKDITVALASLILVIWSTGASLGRIPNNIGPGDSIPVILFGALGGLAILTLLILSFQMFVHILRTKDGVEKILLIVGLAILGPFLAVPYYYTQATERWSK